VAAKFGYIGSQTNLDEQLGNVGSKTTAGYLFFRHCVTQNIAHFFFHATTVTFGPPLQTRFDYAFDVPDHELSHVYLLQINDIMLSPRWITKFPASLRAGIATSKTWCALERRGTVRIAGGFLIARTYTRFLFGPEYQALFHTEPAVVNTLMHGWVVTAGH
jgi:hypothetical protein